MKRIITLLLTVVMIFSAFTFSASAAGEPYINPEINIPFLNTNANSPAIDGKINNGEYGAMPTLNYSDINVRPQFQPNDSHDDFKNWNFYFYATADRDFLYLGWEVFSFVFQPFDRNTVAPDWQTSGDDSYLGNMWKFSNVQFIITRGAPKAGVTEYDNNCLEVGFCQLEDGSVGKYAYRIPKGYSKQTINLESWNASVKNDVHMTTTYEIAVPWDAIGVDYVGYDVQFGLAFSVSAQYDYNNYKGMIEWTDSLLRPRDTDNAGVVTLVSSKASSVLPEGTVPDSAKGAIQLDVDFVNEMLYPETSSLQTNPNFPINSRDSYAMLLEPVPNRINVYRLIATKHGTGSEVEFDEYENGMLVFAVHSNGGSGENSDEKSLAMTIPIGSELTLFGVDTDFGLRRFSNAMLYVSKLSNLDFSESSAEESIEESDVISKEPESSEEENDKSVENDVSAEKIESPSFFDTIRNIKIEDTMPILIVIGAIFIPLVFIVTLVLVIIFSSNKKKKNKK